jgi:hypothetical protein
MKRCFIIFFLINTTSILWQNTLLSMQNSSSALAINKFRKRPYLQLLSSKSTNLDTKRRRINSPADFESQPLEPLFGEKISEYPLKYKQAMLTSNVAGLPITFSGFCSPCAQTNPSPNTTVQKVENLCNPPINNPVPQQTLTIPSSHQPDYHKNIQQLYKQIKNLLDIKCRPRERILKKCRSYIIKKLPRTDIQNIETSFDSVCSKESKVCQNQKIDIISKIISSTDTTHIGKLRDIVDFIGETQQKAELADNKNHEGKPNAP